jgi:hypothetical protein
MILLCGIPSEGPLARVRSRLDELSAPYVMFDQRRFDTMEIEVATGADGLRGHVSIEGARHELEGFGAAYVRLMDDRLLPGLDEEPPGSARRRRCRLLHEGLVRWLDVSRGRVVNRLGDMGSNSSKPYQSQLILQHGFSVPRTLVTNRPDLVLDFRRRVGRVIYKSASGARSIVTELRDEDLGRMDTVRACPVQFQEYLPGHDVRVHTVGDEVFATRIDSTETDYRYAARDDGEVRLAAVELPEAVSSTCVELAAALGLEFAGIDLRVSPDGRVHCLEVNPSPAYSYYEAHTGQPISLAVARLLAGVVENRARSIRPLRGAG